MHRVVARGRTGEHRSGVSGEHSCSERGCGG